jgi:hypothetical protein
LLDLVDVAFGVGLAFGVDGFLNLSLQLEVEPDTESFTARVLDLLRLFQIGAIDLRVVLNLARLDQPE